MSDRIDPVIMTILAEEPSLEWFGFTVQEARRGRALVAVEVRPHHVNGNSMTHGGVVFALADQAFAMAAVTVLSRAVTADAQIHYIAPSRLGDVLVATAQTTYRDERRAIIDVVVRAHDEAVAHYRGTARATRRG